MGTIPGLSTALGLSLAILLSGCSSTRVDCAVIECTSAQWMEYSKAQSRAAQSQQSLGQGSLYDMKRK